MEHEAGRELDEAVHVAIGCCPHPLDRHGHRWVTVGSASTRMDRCEACGVEWFMDPPRIPRYSTDMAAAWTVVEAMRARGYHFRLSQDNGEPWDAWFMSDEWRYSGTADTAPLAICRAALAAVAAVSKERT